MLKLSQDILTGLTSKEVETLRKKFGFNELVKTKKPNLFKKFLSVFKEPMFLLLIIAATLYFILGEPKEAIIMLVFVAFVASITFIQEFKTEQTLNALKNLTSPKVTVMRNGEKTVINSVELVPGDIILLSEGNKIPADCEILECAEFKVDESTLTGESEPVFKVPIKSLSSFNKDYWKKDHLYAGTLAISGTCVARVKSIGLNTEYGKIGKAIIETPDEATPLQKKTGNLVKNLAILGFILCLMVIGLTYHYSHNIIHSILSGLTLAMAIIPEEFPVVLTVFLSLGAFRLAKENALMRRISAVETLGSATVLCVDKTGTITKNSMEVKKIYDYKKDKILDLNSDDYKELLRLFVLSCEQDPFDPMEKAIVEVAKAAGADIGLLYQLENVHTIPFNSITKRMGNIYKYQDGKLYVAAKGSPDTILPLCNLTDEQENTIMSKVDHFASLGLRVLAFADTVTDKLNEDLDDYTLEFKCLIGLQDPPKEGVKEAIKICKTAGVRVVMITGDYSKTAMAIAKEIGLKFKDKAITGEDIDSMTDEELCEAVKSCDIFSRVIPEHKMRIVKALKNNGEIVAMTGDGVNDAPALKNADIGIAMGKRGTEVAKEAADMVLMDDDFTSIVHSLKDGRRIFDNIRKAIVYIMVIHIPIASLALFSPIFNLPQILLPVHIVLLELILDPTCSIVFEGEEAEPHIMEQPPRSPDEPLLTRALGIKVVLQGAALFLATFVPFHYLVDSGFSVNYARSFALMSLIVGNVILVLVNRSNTQYLTHIFREKQNNARFWINGIALAMAFGIIYIPWLRPLFKTEALDGKMLFFAILNGILSIIWWELVKFYQNKKYALYNNSYR